MIKRLTTFLSAALLLCAASLHLTEVQAASVKYKVAIARIWELQKELDKWSAQGWELRSIATSTQCLFNQPSGINTKGECHVIVFERRD